MFHLICSFNYTMSNMHNPRANFIYYTPAG